MKKLWIAVLLLVLVAALVGACAGRTGRQSGEWTPSPVTGSLAIGTRALELVPPDTKTPEGTEPAPAVLPTLVLTATPVAAQTASLPTVAVPTAAPTHDPNLVIITQNDVLRAVTSGAAAEQGATLEDVDVQFTADGKMILTAGRVGYGFINADNVTLVGRLVAVDGKLELQTESVSPRGIVTAMIPTIANQALQQYTSKWYIEEARTTEGQVELRVRP